MQLPKLRRAAGATMPLDGGRGTPVDFSQPQFSLGQSSGGGPLKVSELLLALPWIKGTPVVGAFSTVQDLFVQVQRPSTGLASDIKARIYDNSSTQIAEVTQSYAAVDPVRLVRFGARTRGLLIDSVATKDDTAQGVTYSQARLAANVLLRDLDVAIAQGAGNEVPIPTLRGLGAQAQSFASVNAASIESEVRDLVTRVATSGGGAGEGVHCLAGGARVQRKLMSLPSGQNGASGYRLDPRTGLVIYHYLGLPFYRTQTNEAVVTACTLFAMNLGPTGVNLVYAYGSADSWGLELEASSSGDRSAAREFTVTGAYALVAWETEALRALTGMDCTNV